MNAEMNRDHADTTVPRRPTSAYDVAVIGGGLNGLTTAAYLARAGMKVVLLEAKEHVGGTAITGAFAPGFRADLCRHDIGHLPLHIWKGLGLHPDLKLISSDAEILAPNLNGPSLLLTMRQRGHAGPSLEKLSQSDARRWPEFIRRIRAIAGFLEKMYRAPMPGVDASGFSELSTVARLGLKLRGLGKKDMVEVLRVLPMSIAELLEDEFESPLLRGVLASRGIMHTCLGPRSAGTAFVMLHHQVGRELGAFRSHYRPEGGVGTLAKAIAQCATAAGAELRVNAKVARILMKAGRTAGVVLDSGDEISAQCVVSGVSPRHTFMDLVDTTQLDPELVRAVRNIRYRGVTAKVHLALDALPKFRGIEESPQNPVRSIVIAPTIDYLEQGYDDAKYGRVSSKPFLDVFIPTISDPSMAPAGKHVMSVHVQYAPHKLRDSGEGHGATGIRAWDATSHDALADHVIKTLAEYAPDLTGLVKHRHVLTPRDLEEQFALPDGNPYHGEIALDQALFMRPVPACSRYRTPVPGLYLCGSGAHPGGAIPGQAGASAAKQIQRDSK